MDLEKRFILALDQGTTSSRAILFDSGQRIVSVAQRDFAQHYPREGWVEHDPMEIYSTQAGMMAEAVTKSGIDPREIAAIGVTNQRETAIVWERSTGRPIYPAIVWQCRRTAAICDRLKAEGAGETVSYTHLHSSFSGAEKGRSTAKAVRRRFSGFPN